MNKTQCCECRDCEHENYDNDIKFTTVISPEENRIVKSGYMCCEHRTMFEIDGYNIYIK